jgi:hypothetical protein
MLCRHDLELSERLVAFPLHACADGTGAEPGLSR